MTTDVNEKNTLTNGNTKRSALGDVSNARKTLTSSKNQKASITTNNKIHSNTNDTNINKRDALKAKATKITKKNNNATNTRLRSKKISVKVEVDEAKLKKVQAQSIQAQSQAKVKSQAKSQVEDNVDVQPKVQLKDILEVKDESSDSLTKVQAQTQTSEIEPETDNIEKKELEKKEPLSKPKPKTKSQKQKQKQKIAVRVDEDKNDNKENDENIPPPVAQYKKRPSDVLVEEETLKLQLLEQQEQDLQLMKKAKFEETIDWDDLDEEDADDPLMVSEYVVDVFEYLRELEKKTVPDPSYLIFQKTIKPEMRSILVDWVVEVHSRFRLLPETLFLTVNIMDRFMSKEMIEVDKLQLLAISSMFVAAKYEEVFSPSIQSYVIVSDNTYSEAEILEAEKFVLQVLDFNMSYPNPMNFLRRISKADNYDVQTRTLGKYLLEISLVDHRFIGMYPSLISAAAMYLSRKILNRGTWDANLIHYSGGYDVDDIIVVCEMMMDYLVQPITHEAFFKKYASKRFMKASIIARQWAKKAIIKGLDLADNSD